MVSLPGEVCLRTSPGKSSGEVFTQLYKFAQYLMDLPSSPCMSNSSLTKSWLKYEKYIWVVLKKIQKTILCIILQCICGIIMNVPVSHLFIIPRLLLVTLDTVVTFLYNSQPHLGKLNWSYLWSFWYWIALVKLGASNL